jgi:hypothetical protein
MPRGSRALYCFWLVDALDAIVESVDEAGV